MKRNILVTLATTHHGFLRGIARHAHEHGWHINTVMAYTGKVPSKWSGDGVLSHCGFSDDLAAQVNALRLPTVELTSVNRQVKAARIDADYAAFGVAAAEYFLQRKFKRFAAAPLADDPLNRLRIDGFIARVAREGYDTVRLPALIEDLEAGRIDWPRRVEAIRSLLRQIPKPVAVFAYNDSVGVDLIDLCGEMGLLVPEQVAVMGVDNDELLCEASPVPLSSVCFDLAELAYQGAAFLEEIMAGRTRERHRLVPAGSGIVTRQSTDVVAIENVRVAKATRYIMEHIGDPNLSVQAVAAHAGITGQGLRKAFLRHVGRSISSEISVLRDERICQLLHTTNLSTKEIAAATGFSSGNYLARFFRRHHGMSPREFRRCHHLPAPHPDPP